MVGATKFIWVNTVNDKVVRYSLAYSIRAKMIGEGRPVEGKFLVIIRQKTRMTWNLIFKFFFIC